MRSFGYSSLATVATIAAIAVVGTTAYVAVTNLEPMKRLFLISQTGSSTPGTTNTSPPSAEGVLSVADVNSNKEAYVGQRVRVAGDLRILVMYSERPCAADEAMCDTSMGARLELWQTSKTTGDENMLLLFKNNAPYPCVKNSPGIFTCGSHNTSGATIIEGTWIKDREPIQWVGGSGGVAPTPIKWRDRYFLNID